MERNVSVNDIAVLMRDAAMNTTYKPALLKALVSIVTASSALDVSLKDIGSEFAQMYWDQVAVFRLRQSPPGPKTATVIPTIQKLAEAHNAYRYRDLPPEGQSEIARQMAAILPINVLTAFHTSAPPEVEPLFHWAQGFDHITLTRGGYSVLKSNPVALEAIANNRWAEFLETCNPLVPRILQKVETDIASERRPLRPARKYLSDVTDPHCFYCESAIDAESDKPEVDHVIPWSFLFDDPMWDLVLACRKCNNAKREWLPAERFLSKLLDRNERLRLDSRHDWATADQVRRLFQNAVSQQWPRFWEPHW